MSLIEQLETAFHNRIEFRSSDGTDPYVPTQATQPVTVPETTQETFWVTEPTNATVPTYTEPATTIPVYTEPTTVPTLPVQTLPPATQSTQPTIVLGNQAAQPEPYQPGSATDGSSIFGLLIVIIVLTILATTALLFRAAGQGKRRKKRKYRR